MTDIEHAGHVLVARATNPAPADSDARLSWSWPGRSLMPSGFTAKTTVLIENVRHHIGEEE